jgi:coatomer subunit beta
MDQNSSSQAGGLAFTLVADESESLATSQDLRAALEKGTDELKLETLRRIVISTLNGSPHVSWQRVGRGTSARGDH